MIKDNPQFRAAVDNLIETIKNTKEYSDYQSFTDTNKYSAEEMELIRRSKKLHFEIVRISDDLRGSDYEDSLLREYEELSENTVVYEFAHAEQKYAEMCKEVLSEIMDTIDIG